MVPESLLLFGINPNPIVDFQSMWQYQFMQHAFEAGTLIAILAGVTGYFVVLRRSAFVAHAFSDIGFAGAAGIVLISQPPIEGLLGATILAALAIAALGRRATNRDTQIGIVLAFSLGLGLLFISLYTGNITEAYSILFGEILAISTSAEYVTLYGCILIFVLMAFLYRPLLFASLDEDVAEAKGLPMLFLGTAFMVVVAVAVSFSIEVTGVLLIFSLMVTPAATAAYLSRKPQRAILISVAIALAVTWSGIFISFYTPYPVSFYITAEAFGLYVLVRVVSAAMKFRVRLADDKAQRLVNTPPPDPSTGFPGGSEP
jgi:zinc/manganese transport system permease protein